MNNKIQANDSNFCDLLRSSKAEDVLAALEYLGADWSMNKGLDADLRNNRNFALRAVTICGYIYQEFDETLRNDVEIATAAVKLNGLNLYYAPDTLKDNKEFALIAFNSPEKHSGYRLDSVSKRLQDDKDVVLAAVSKEDTGTALKHASNRLKDDYDVVMLAVKNSRYYISAIKRDALKYASTRLQDNEEIVEAAVFANYEALEFASDRLRSDRNFVEKMMDKKIDTFLYASEELRADPDLYLSYIEKVNFGGWVGLPQHLLNNKEWMLKAVEKSPEVVLALSQSELSLPYEDEYQIIKKALDYGKKYKAEDVNCMGKGSQIGHFLPHLKSRHVFKKYPEIVQLLNQY